MGFNPLPPQEDEYWSLKCGGIKDTIEDEEEWADDDGNVLESAKCGEKIFIEKWVRDVIINYQKERDSDKDKSYDDLVDLELKNEKGEVIGIWCKCCCEVPYQWDDWGGNSKDWVRDTPPYKLIRETSQYFMEHYTLVKWTEELELDYSKGKYKLKNKLSQAENHERLLEFDHAAEIYKELGMDDEVIRIRKGARNKVDQTIIQGDYIDDRDTIVKDSVLNRTNVGASEDKFTKLKELKEMFESGFISKEEMEDVKKEILGK